jgi:hypothetical protein
VAVVILIQNCTNFRDVTTTAKEIPNKILNAIDSFNIESDEEFFWI